MVLTRKRKEGMPARTKRARKIKKTLAVIAMAALALCLFSGMGASAAAPVVPVHWKGAVGATALSDDAVLIGGVTYVPFRAFCTLADNCEVRWDASTRTAAATTSSGATVRATVGEEYITYGERCFYTAAPVRIVRDRLYVPVRPLSKCFGIDVAWNASSRSVTLTKTGASVRSDAGVYDADALYWLSRIIDAESRGEPFRGQMAVGNVVLNRVTSRDYPNTIYDVIFDRTYGVQFTPTVNGTIYRVPSATAQAAAKACLEGYSLSDDILYFFNPSIAASHWISANRTYAFRIGGHVFYN